MSTYRALLLSLIAFAVSLGSLGVAAGTAWLRCGHGTECSGELALGIAAVAPASLLLCVMLLLIRKRTESSVAARVLLVVTLGVAMAPLAAFVLRDPLTLALVALLFAGLASLAVIDDESETAAASPGTRVRAETATDASPTRSSRDDQLAARLQATEERLAAISLDLEQVKLALPPAATGASSNGAHRSMAVEISPASPQSISLLFANLREFDELVRIYEALWRLPAVSGVEVRRYATAFAWIDVTTTAASTRDLLVEFLAERQHPPARDTDRPFDSRMRDGASHDPHRPSASSMTDADMPVRR